MPLRRAAAAAILSFCSVGSATAHPHVWVTTKATILYDGTGRVAGVRHAWMFDEGYTAYATQGMETGPDGKPKPEKLAELAQINMDSLVDQDFFTSAKANGVKQAFGSPREAAVTVEGGRMTLAFVLPLKAPAAADRVFSLEVYDPTFFVDFAVSDDADAAQLEGAPKGCALEVRRPKLADNPPTLSESFFSALSAAADFGAQFSSRIVVSCR